MDHQLIVLQPPIPTADFKQVEQALRVSGILTCFDQRVDPANALRFVSEKVRFGTEARALIDLNVFRDILSLGRPDAGRDSEQRRLAAALVLFFQTAEIQVEPCMALHESPGDAEQELDLFRRIDSAEPQELLNVFRGSQGLIELPSLPEPANIPHGLLEKRIHGTAILEIALLKLATLLRERCSNIERIERFLRWSFEEFLFVQEPLLLALHQLAGNRPKPLLRGHGKIDPGSRLKGVKNAYWDCMLIREWSRRINEQSSANRIWLLCSRDQTLSEYARKLVITGSKLEDPRSAVESIVTNSWPAHHAKRITDLYFELTTNADCPSRAFNRSGQNLELDRLKAELEDRLVS
jgi:hypothetical protein